MVSRLGVKCKTVDVMGLSELIRDVNCDNSQILVAVMPNYTPPFYIIHSATLHYEFPYPLASHTHNVNSMIDQVHNLETYNCDILDI